MTREKLDLLAATSTFCPVVALLGAKRPQNRPWFWIVLSLWGVAVLPVVESLIVQPDDWIEVHPLWQWFDAILVFVGCANHLPTRFWSRCSWRHSANVHCCAIFCRGIELAGAAAVGRRQEYSAGSTDQRTPRFSALGNYRRHRAAGRRGVLGVLDCRQTPKVVANGGGQLEPLGSIFAMPMAWFGACA